VAEDPRYVVGLQTVDDRSCYKDFFETDKLEEAKREADEGAERNQRSTLVFDRKFGKVYKKEIVQSTDSVVKKALVEELPVKKGRGRPKKTKEQTPTDDYF